MNAGAAMLELTEPKEFSRLLYTNPVCLLSTTYPIDGHETHPISPSENEKKSSKEDRTKNAIDVHSIPATYRNVMVLSWLTATNNAGRFMFSINKRRHTVSALVNDIQNNEFSIDNTTNNNVEFVLSVPVKGMEDLLRNVGQTSGKFGSKFTQDHDPETSSPNDDATQKPTRPMSKRQKKKQPRFPRGIPGLTAVVPGDPSSLASQSTSLFAIRGTVAHLVCETYNVLQNSSVIDEDHILVLAKVTKAFVHPSYWDKDKLLFTPQKHHPPYLSFFGSQTFGYVECG